MIAGARSRRGFLAALVCAGLYLLAGAPVQATEPHRLALQISDDDPARMRGVLDIAANVSRHYSGEGVEVEIAIVAFNGGLDMLLADRSPVKERVAGFAKSMPNVSFVACGNTLETLAVKEGRQPPLIDGVSVVKAAVVTLMELSESKWTIVRP
jgi:uncharacterized protein